jgi:hypothetical protein
MKIACSIFFIVSIYYLKLYLVDSFDGALYAFALTSCATILTYVFSIQKPSPLWFRNKRWGYGCTPNTWEGWLFTVGALLLVLAVSFNIDSDAHSASDALITLVPYVSIIVATLIVVCLRTGEKWEFKWGNKK